MILFALLSPRVAIVWIWLTDDLLSRSFDSDWLPLLGFFLLPWTTLAYAIMWEVGTDKVSGVEWFFVIVAFLTDIGAIGGGSRARRRRG